MGSFKRPISQLGISASHNAAPSTSHSGSGVHGGGSPVFFNPRVKALLNRLTTERFDAISDQIITFVNRSESDKDGRTLTQVIKHILAKATEDDAFPEMCARLCCKMMEQISPQIQDERIEDAEGKPFAGGQLFRKILLNCCQEDFEREWGTEETTAAAATKTTKFQAVEEANRRTKGGEESVLHLDRCYAEVKAKRRRVGVAQFIAEIFKVGILPERHVHRCIRRFLDNPEEAAIEGLCKLLTTVGSLLDTGKYRVHLDMDFMRMQELTKNKNISSRMVLMLRDVIELRELEWVPRTATPAPTTTADVHQEAAAEAEEESYMQQNAGMSRSVGGGDHDAVESSQPEDPSLTLVPLLASKERQAICRNSKKPAW
ncbi:armadillo-type protein [Russula brevipes]|nr:armadillo-type protein [Russula brevipes]